MDNGITSVTSTQFLTPSSEDAENPNEISRSAPQATSASKPQGGKGLLPGIAGGSAKERQQVQKAVISVFARLQEVLNTDPAALERQLTAIFTQAAPGTSGHAKIRNWIKTGSFPADVKVRILPESDMNGGLAAYSKNTIFVSSALLAKSDEEIAQVLAEDLGHHFDSKLGASDSAGDEGAIFAKTLFGGALPSQSSSLKTEDDRGTILVDGQRIGVEFSRDDSSYVTLQIGGDGDFDGGKPKPKYEILINGKKVFEGTVTRFGTGNLQTVSIPKSALDGEIISSVTVRNLSEHITGGKDDDVIYMGKVLVGGELLNLSGVTSSLGGQTGLFGLQSLPYAIVRRGDYTVSISDTPRVWQQVQDEHAYVTVQLGATIDQSRPHILPEYEIFINGESVYEGTIENYGEDALTEIQIQRSALKGKDVQSITIRNKNDSVSAGGARAGNDLNLLLGDIKVGGYLVNRRQLTYTGAARSGIYSRNSPIQALANIGRYTVDLKDTPPVWERLVLSGPEITRGGKVEFTDARDTKQVIFDGGPNDLDGLMNGSIIFDVQRNPFDSTGVSVDFFAPRNPVSAGTGPEFWPNQQATRTFSFGGVISQTPDGWTIAPGENDDGRIRTYILTAKAPAGPVDDTDLPPVTPSSTQASDVSFGITAGQLTPGQTYLNALLGVWEQKMRQHYAGVGNEALPGAGEQVTVTLDQPTARGDFLRYSKSFTVPGNVVNPPNFEGFLSNLKTQLEDDLTSGLPSLSYPDFQIVGSRRSTSSLIRSGFPIWFLQTNHPSQPSESAQTNTEFQSFTNTAPGAPQYLPESLAFLGGASPRNTAHISVSGLKRANTLRFAEDESRSGNALQAVTAGPARDAIAVTDYLAEDVNNQNAQAMIDRVFASLQSRIIDQYGQISDRYDGDIVAALQSSGGFDFRVRFTGQYGEYSLRITINPQDSSITDVASLAAAVKDQLKQSFMRYLSQPDGASNRGGLHWDRDNEGTIDKGRLQISRLSIQAKFAAIDFKPKEDVRLHGFSLDQAAALTAISGFDVDNPAHLIALHNAIMALGNELKKNKAPRQSPLFRQAASRLAAIESGNPNYETATSEAVKETNISASITSLMSGYNKYQASLLEIDHEVRFHTRPEPTDTLARLLREFLDLPSTSPLKDTIEQILKNPRAFPEIKFTGVDYYPPQHVVVDENPIRTYALQIGDGPLLFRTIGTGGGNPPDTVTTFEQFDAWARTKHHATFVNHGSTFTGSFAALLNSETLRGMIGIFGQVGTLPDLLEPLRTAIKDRLKVIKGTDSQGNEVQITNQQLANFDRKFAMLFETQAVNTLVSEDDPIGGTPASTMHFRTFNDALGAQILAARTQFDTDYKDYAKRYVSLFEFREAKRLIYQSGYQTLINQFPDFAYDPKKDWSLQESDLNSAVATVKRLLGSIPGAAYALVNAVENMQRRYIDGLDDRSFENLETDADKVYDGDVRMVRSIPLVGRLLAAIEEIQNGRDASEDLYAFSDQMLVFVGAILEAVPGGQAAGTAMIIAGSAMMLAKDLPRLIDDAEHGASGLQIAMDALGVFGDLIGIVAPGLGAMSRAFSETVEIADSELENLNSNLKQMATSTGRGTSVIEMSSLSRQLATAGKVFGIVGLVDMAGSLGVSVAQAAKTGDWVGFVSSLSNILIQGGAGFAAGFASSLRDMHSTAFSASQDGSQNFTNASEPGFRYELDHDASAGDLNVYRKINISTGERIGEDLYGFTPDKSGSGFTGFKMGSISDVKTFQQKFNLLRFGTYDEHGNIIGLKAGDQHFRVLQSVPDEEGKITVFEVQEDGTRIGTDLYSFDLETGTKSPLQESAVLGQADTKVTYAEDGKSPRQVRIGQKRFTVHPPDRTNPAHYYIDETGKAVSVLGTPSKPLFALERNSIDGFGAEFDVYENRPSDGSRAHPYRTVIHDQNGKLAGYKIGSQYFRTLGSEGDLATTLIKVNAEGVPTEALPYSYDPATGRASGRPLNSQAMRNVIGEQKIHFKPGAPATPFLYEAEGKFFEIKPADSSVPHPYFEKDGLKILLLENGGDGYRTAIATPTFGRYLPLDPALSSKPDLWKSYLTIDGNALTEHTAPAGFGYSAKVELVDTSLSNSRGKVIWLQGDIAYFFSTPTEFYTHLTGPARTLPLIHYTSDNAKVEVFFVNDNASLNVTKNPKRLGVGDNIYNLYRAPDEIEDLLAGNVPNTNSTRVFEIFGLRTLGEGKRNTYLVLLENGSFEVVTPSKKRPGLFYSYDLNTGVINKEKIVRNFTLLPNVSRSSSSPKAFASVDPIVNRINPAEAEPRQLSYPRGRRPFVTIPMNDEDRAIGFPRIERLNSEYRAVDLRNGTTIIAKSARSRETGELVFYEYDPVGQKTAKKPLLQTKLGEKVFFERDRASSRPIPRGANEYAYAGILENKSLKERREFFLNLLLGNDSEGRLSPLYLDRLDLENYRVSTMSPTDFVTNFFTLKEAEGATMPRGLLETLRNQLATVYARSDILKRIVAFREDMNITTQNPVEIFIGFGEDSVTGASSAFMAGIIMKGYGLKPANVWQQTGSIYINLSDTVNYKFLDMDSGIYRREPAWRTILHEMMHYMTGAGDPPKHLMNEHTPEGIGPNQLFTNLVLDELGTWKRGAYGYVKTTFLGYDDSGLKIEVERYFRDPQNMHSADLDFWYALLGDNRATGTISDSAYVPIDDAPYVPARFT